MSYDVVSLLPAFCAAFLGQSAFEEGKVAFHERLNVAVLDYSVESLHAVDDYLDAVRPYKDIIENQDYTNTILATGCYVGEVLRRNAFETWRWANYDEFIEKQPQMKELVPEDLMSAAVLISADNRKSTYPLNKVIRNLEEGPENEIYYYVARYAADPK
ncbi:hypothetical protein [Dongia sp.]|uniref:hypothetical protein n=1 Tax=Dongia sp. TaxID=1977262 RepID=UPI0035B4C822